MRKLRRPLLAIFALTLSLAGCGSETGSTTAEDRVAPSVFDAPAITWEQDSSEILRFPAGQHFQATVLFPRPRLTDTIDARAASSFALDTGPTQDNFSQLIEKSLHAPNAAPHQCLTQFVALRSSYELTVTLPGETRRRPNVCVDAIAFPSDESSSPTCAQLVDNFVAGNVVRYCRTRLPRLLYGVSETQSTRTLGTFRDYASMLRQSSERFEANRAARQEQLQKTFAATREAFEKSEKATLAIDAQLPWNKNGLKGLTKSSAESIMFYLMADMPYDTKAKIISVVSNTIISVVTELLFQGNPKVDGIKSVAGGAAFTRINDALHKTFKDAGYNMNDRSITDLIAVIALVGAGYVADIWQSPSWQKWLNQGAEAHAEEVADRVMGAIISNVAYYVSVQFGPLGAVLKTELRILYFESKALGRYAHYFVRSNRLADRVDDLVNQRNLGGVNDEADAHGVYARYLDVLEATNR